MARPTGRFEDIGSRGSWAEEGGALLPYLAAYRFGVRIVVAPDGADVIGPQTYLGFPTPVIPLNRPAPDHWEATDPHTVAGDTAAYSSAPGHDGSGNNAWPVPGGSPEDPALADAPGAIDWQKSSRSLPPDPNDENAVEACVEIAVVGFRPGTRG